MLIRALSFYLLIFFNCFSIAFPFLLDQKGKKKSSSLEALLFEHRSKKQANRPLLIASLFVRYAASEQT